MRKHAWGAALAAGFVSLSLSLGLVGCADKADEAPKQVEQVEEAAPEEPAQKADTRQTFGDQVEGAHEVALTNGLGTGIVSLDLRPAGTEEPVVRLMPDGSHISAGEEVRLFVAPLEGNPAFDVTVVLEETGETVGFAEVPLYDIAKGLLVRNEEGAAHVDYTTVEGAEGTSRDTFAGVLEADPAVTDAGAVVAPAAESVASGNAGGNDATVSYEQNVEAPVEEYVPAEEPQVTEEVPVSMPVEAPEALEQTDNACMGEGVVLR